MDHYHAFMLGALLFSSLRWITVKYAGESVLCFGHDFLGTNYGVAGDGIYYRSRWLVEQNDPHALQFCGIAVSLTSVPRPFLPRPQSHLPLQSPL